MSATETGGPGAGGVFHGVSFDPRERTSRVFARADLDRELKDPNVFSWIDIQAPDISVMNAILKRLEIDLVLVSHFEAPEVLPRIVERPDCLAFYLYEIEEPDRHLDTSQGLREIEFVRMILVLGVDYVITYHRRPLAAVEDVKAGCAESFRLAGKTPGFIAFLFLQRCLYDYAHLSLANDNYLDRLEASVARAGADGLTGEVSTAGRNILTLKKLAASLHIVLMLLATKRSPFISNEARASFNEMLQNALAVRAAIDSSRDLLDGILAAVQAAAANRTSEIARVLTVMSGVLLPLTLITGIYGMNFEHMPELRWEVGYFGVLGFMALTALSLLVVFWRLGWVGSGRSRR
ncbi:MAG TPA: magnesium transporter CorA family protein [Solirubrobacterales bacterium]|nr:magnesium transporter CorA family protein [Solirubrobacterales bacterium]